MTKLDLIAYANKYKISVSTLRRRIRKRHIKFSLEYGRYMLEDTPETLKPAPLFSRTKTLIPQDPTQIPVHHNPTR